MKRKLIQAFNDALENYVAKKNRGYKMGLFSNWRHSFSKTKKLKDLEYTLLNSKNDENALSIVIEHFLSKKATFNNHSFNNYLIDELKKSILQIDWDCFTSKAIKKYKGPLYRGTSQPHEKIFQEGFKELSSSTLIEDYLKFRNSHIGISTSKDFDCAMEYALNNKRSSNERYIYAVNYRDSNGYDILQTGKARGLNFNSLFHRDRRSGWRKQEVNIKEKISNLDIIGAFKILKDGILSWIDNPYYQLEKKYFTP